MIIPNIWENKKWQPNHQPVIYFRTKKLEMMERLNHPAIFPSDCMLISLVFHSVSEAASWLAKWVHDENQAMGHFGHLWHIPKKKEQPIKHGPWRIHVCMVVYMLTWPGFLLMVNVTINIAHIRIRHGWGLALPASSQPGTAGIIEMRSSARAGPLVAQFGKNFALKRTRVFVAGETRWNYRYGTIYMEVYGTSGIQERSWIRIRFEKRKWGTIILDLPEKAKIKNLFPKWIPIHGSKSHQGKYNTSITFSKARSFINMKWDLFSLIDVERYLLVIRLKILCQLWRVESEQMPTL